MRTRHATVLSVAGVIAAGLVAALVNAQALAGSSGRATTPIAPVQLDASKSVEPSDTAATPTIAPITEAIPTTLPESDAKSSQVLFDLGSSGTVTLNDVNGVLDVVAIAPASGWSVSAMTPVDATTVVIELASAGTSLRATAALRDSVITVTLTETPTGGTPATVVVTQPATPPPPTAALPPTTVRSPTSIVPTTEPHDDDSSGHGSDDDSGHDDDSRDD